MYDTIVIGGGPAGITAGIYAARGNLKTLILHFDSSSLEKATKIENYYGFTDGISGKKLYEDGIKQAKNIGIEINKEEVIKIEYETNGYKVITTENEYLTKTIILALGTTKKSSNISGISEFEGKGVSYCAICDGFFYKDKEVSVLGSGKYALSETNDLINVAKKITILTNGEKAPEFRANNVEIKTEKIREVRGTEKVEKVIFEDNSEIDIDGIFVAQGVASANDFAKKMGIIIEKNYIKVDEKMKTNISGIYACGDCVGGLLQISKSVYEGTIAGLEAIKYVKEKDIKSK